MVWQFNDEALEARALLISCVHVQFAFTLNSQNPGDAPGQHLKHVTFDLARVPAVESHVQAYLGILEPSQVG